MGIEAKFLSEFLKTAMKAPSPPLNTAADLGNCGGLCVIRYSLRFIQLKILMSATGEEAVGLNIQLKGIFGPLVTIDLCLL